MHADRCDVAEPPLELVGADHWVACVRADELAGPDSGAAPDADLAPAPDADADADPAPDGATVRSAGGSTAGVPTGEDSR
jgi:hypothetical protein